jgi:hypothetical protein
VFANTLVPVETSFKVAIGPLANGGPQVILSHLECLLQAQALKPARPLVAFASHSTRVTLHGSCGRAQCPLKALLWSTAQASCGLWWISHHQAIRRWRPPRVTNTVGLQLDHMVLLNAITQCKALEITHFAIGSHSCKHKWVRGLSNRAHTRPTHPQGAQPAKCPSSTSIYSPKPNRVIGAKLHFLQGHQTQRWWHRSRGGDAPQRSNPMASLTSCGHRTGGGGTGQGWQCHPKPAPCFPSSLEKWGDAPP